MVIELLTFEVDPELRETFVREDNEIWTVTLAAYEGFLGKEIWISPDEASLVVVVIRWTSFEAWQAIPAPVLDETEARMRQVLGNTYRLADSRRFQQRKFVQTN